MTATRKPRLKLTAETAADLMTPNPVSVPADGSVQEAIALLVDRGFTAAPVIDRAGRAVGVISQTDILVRDREGTGYVPDEAGPLPDGFHLEAADPRPVSDVMTPGVLAVTPDTPAARVVAQMLALKVHRVFVADRQGTLVGVIGLFDILRHLRP